MLLTFYHNAFKPGCTLCNSATAKSVRAMVLSDSPFYHLVIVLLPFAICFLVAWIVYHGGLAHKKHQHEWGKSTTTK